LLIIW